MSRRSFTAPPEQDRCRQDITLRDGSGARCMRRAVIDGRCRQHAASARDRFCSYCGGNDDADAGLPTDHCTDCPRPKEHA